MSPATKNCNKIEANDRHIKSVICKPFNALCGAIASSEVLNCYVFYFSLTCALCLLLILIHARSQFSLSLTSKTAVQVIAKQRLRHGSLCLLVIMEKIHYQANKITMGMAVWTEACKTAILYS